MSLRSTPGSILRQPTTVDDLSRCLADAHAAGQSILPIGCGSKWQWTGSPGAADMTVSTRALSRIVAHEADDMTVTVEAGVTLSELNLAMTRSGQHLPLDPPVPKTTTVGSLIATDSFGPLRLTHGKVRDLLIGVTVVLADGTIVKGGGRVVKNVAGYDLMKLFTGSYGTLAVIAQATFKLRPYPQMQSDFIVQAPSLPEIIVLGEQMLGRSIQPLYVLAMNAVAAARLGLSATPSLLIGCSGSAKEISVQRERLKAIAEVRQLTGSAGASLYVTLRDLPTALLESTTFGAKISASETVLPQLLAQIESVATEHQAAVAILAHIGVGVAFLRCSGATLAVAEAVVDCVRAAGGWLVFDALPLVLQGSIDAWPMLPPAIALMREVKRALDPHSRLNPGRFVGGI